MWRQRAEQERKIAELMARVAELEMQLKTKAEQLVEAKNEVSVSLLRSGLRYRYP